MQNIKHGMLRDDIYKRLRDLIINQDYKIGEALTECKITKDMGVSRTPVREAFAQLYADGLVDFIPNKGVKVRGLTENDIEDMYDIRSYIESVSSQRASELINNTDIENLEKILAEESEFIKINDFQQFLKTDFDFHYGIIKLSKSRIYENLLTSMMEYTKSARKNSISMGSRARDAYEEHIAILTAIRNKDTVNAPKLMKIHIMNAKKSFIKNMFEKENSKYE